MKRALITGAAGFVGRWMSAALADRGYSVTGLATELPAINSGSVGMVRGAPAFPGMHWMIGDIRDASHVHAAVTASVPHLVVHLAAISHVGTAAADPETAWNVNVTATARLFRELAELRAGKQAESGYNPRVLIVGSAEQYGRHDEAEPLTEAAALRPLTVYAATKCAQELLALQQWRSTGVEVIAARSFNHSGPGQEPRFLVPALVARALELRKSGGNELRLGNLSPVRDFLHVADVVAAYISLCELGTPGEVYNVSGGRGYSVQSIAQQILDRVGVKARLSEDPEFVRPVEVPSLVGNSEKLQRATGWQAQRSFDVLIDDLIHAATQ